MTTTTKCRKGDLIAWEETHSSMSMTKGVSYSSHWYIGKVSHASREGQAKSAGVVAYKDRYSDNGRGDTCRDFDLVPNRLVMPATAFTVSVDELIEAVKNETPWNRTLDQIKDAARRFLA